MQVLVWFFGMALVLGCQMDDGDGEVRGSKSGNTEDTDKIAISDDEIDDAAAEREAHKQQIKHANAVFRNSTSWERVPVNNDGNLEADILTSGEDAELDNGASAVDGKVETVWRRDVRQFIPTEGTTICQEYEIGGDESSFSSILSKGGRDSMGNALSCTIKDEKDIEPIYQYMVITRTALACMRDAGNELICVQHKDAKPAKTKKASHKRLVSSNAIKYNPLSDETYDMSFRQPAKGGGKVYKLFRNSARNMSKSHKERGLEFDGLIYIYLEGEDNSTQPVSESGCIYSLRITTFAGIMGASSIRRKSVTVDPNNQ